MSTKNTKRHESMIIFGFPGVGKTYAFNHQDELGLELVDSDSSNFHWMKDDDGNDLLDENGKKIVHPAWPANYVQYIELIGREQAINPDYIMVSTHEEVVNALMDRRFLSITLLPDKSMKENFIQRFKDRGSPESFIDNLNKNWDNFIDGTIERINAHKCSKWNMLMTIREGGKIQNMSDLLRKNLIPPFESFDGEGW